MNSQLIIPVGTQIVSRTELYDSDGALLSPRGAVGVIVTAPIDHTHSYRILFTNNVESSLTRKEFSLRKQHQAFELTDARDEAALREFIIYRCVIGSRAYGLETEASDTDRRGIYLPPAALHWSLAGVPEQLENEAEQANQECYWELQKFLTLALKANPNILECLYSPLVEHAAPLAQELLAMRDCFLSQLVYQTYNGYVMSQFKKLEQDVRTTGEPNWKHAMHLIRLLMSGISVLRDGFVNVHVGARRDLLLSLRRGELPWQEVNALRLRLHTEFDGALNFTRLPERPDYARANAFLLKARRAMVEGESL